MNQSVNYNMWTTVLREGSDRTGDSSSRRSCFTVLSSDPFLLLKVRTPRNHLQSTSAEQSIGDVKHLQVMYSGAQEFLNRTYCLQ